MSLGALFFVIAALILGADAFDILKGSVKWVELAAAFVVLGVAFAGTALPAFVIGRKE